jgi:hypothetical protein
MPVGDGICDPRTEAPRESPVVIHINHHDPDVPHGMGAWRWHVLSFREEKQGSLPLKLHEDLCVTDDSEPETLKELPCFLEVTDIENNYQLLPRMKVLLHLRDLPSLILSKDNETESSTSPYGTSLPLLSLISPKNLFSSALDTAKVLNVFCPAA